jgi:hypothetical protein
MASQTGDDALLQEAINCHKNEVICRMKEEKVEGAEVKIKLKVFEREFSLTILEMTELERDHLIEPTPGQPYTYHIKCGCGFPDRWQRVKGYLKNKGLLTRREAKEL